MNKNILVLGMAKSTTKLSSGPSRNLELDFLRLSYFTEKLGDTYLTRGYFAVHNEIVAKRVDNWFQKYQCPKERIEIIICANFYSEQERLIIEEEKKNNTNFTNSIAKKSQEISEKILENYIKSKNPFENIITRNNFTKIDWDYFAIYKP